MCGWKFEIIEENVIEFGGIKEVVGYIKGENVFVCLKYESGVYCV